ncbi:beta-lactamase family protein [Delphinella strobiligena]|nr:beta-lactamase family protein [Delphinella strobiligena]
MDKLKPSKVQELERLVDEACADHTRGIPGATFVVVDKDGKELLAHSAGRRGSGSTEPMTLDNIFWIASCTKMLTGIACMQLVEQGKLSLDDVRQVEQLSPELKDVKVLQSDGTLVEKKKGITLRMLLTHTAGFGYTFFNEKLRDHSRPTGYDEFSGNEYDMLQPLVHQPGEAWQYGISVDWAGVLLERVTGQSLNDYLHQNVFQPLGLKNISFFPTKTMKSRLVHMHQRATDGTLTHRDHLLRQPLVIESDADIRRTFNSGGAGCFAKPQDYCRVLAVLLNDGTCPTTGIQLLKKATVDEMFTNQIPKFPDFGRNGIPAAKPDLTNAVPDIYPIPGNGPQGWGLTFMLTGGATGRSSTTGFWAGLPNLWWWCDREKGVAGIVCTQILPFGDAQVLGLWAKVESAIYAALGKS